MTEKGDYVVYIDESGDHGLKNVDSNYPIFVLTFCCFNISEYVNKAVPALQSFKFKYRSYGSERTGHCRFKRPLLLLSFGCCLVSGLLVQCSRRVVRSPLPPTPVFRGLLLGWVVVRCRKAGRRKGGFRFFFYRAFLFVVDVEFPWFHLSFFKISELNCSGVYCFPPRITATASSVPPFKGAMPNL